MERNVSGDGRVTAGRPIRRAHLTFIGRRHTRSMLVPVPPQIGYPALAALVLGESAGLPLPGETALITAGGLVAGGHLTLPSVILVAARAAICGDTVGYWVGRRGGRALLLRDGWGATHRRDAVLRADRF